MRSEIRPISRPDKTLQTFQFRFAGRVVLQELVGQADGAERKADRLADMTLSGNGEFTTAATEVHHQDI